MLLKRGPVTHAEERFRSGPAEIPVDRYFPAAPGAYPAVLLLHGSEGDLYGLWYYKEVAEALASQGYVVLLVHYFQRTGTRPPADQEAIYAHFLEWLETIRDAAAYARSLPEVDSNRIGLVGGSLGAYLALAAATQDHSYCAVVELFGGLTPPFDQDAGALPPVLILHGEEDKTVPVSEAHDLEALLKMHGVPYESRIFPGQGHGFNGLAVVEAMSRALRFLERYLKNAA